MNARQFITLLFILTFLVSQNLFLLVPDVNAVTGDRWRNSSYQYRKTLTFDNAESTEDLVNFPVLVALTAANFDFSKTQSAGQDVRFVDADNSTELPYEIESWDAGAKQAFIWVNVPKIDARSSTDFMYMYYGNPEASDAQNIENVWNDQFKAVLHFNENTLDSTSYQNSPGDNGSVSGGGKVSSGRYFDGTAHLLFSSNMDSQNITIATWIYSTNVTEGSQTIFNNKRGGCSTSSEWYGIDTKINSWQTDNRRFVAEWGNSVVGCNSLATAPNLVEKSTWKYLVMTVSRDVGKIQLFIDNQLLSEKAISSLPLGSKNARIGAGYQDILNHRFAYKTS